MEPRDMMRSEGQRASRPAAPQPGFLASASPEASGGLRAGRDCRPAAPPEPNLLLPVSRLNNEPQTASGHFQQPRPLPRKQSPLGGSVRRRPLRFRCYRDCRTMASRSEPSPLWACGF